MGYYLGIDQSLRFSGFCILPEKDTNQLPDYKLLNTKNMRGVNRLKYIQREARDFIAGREILYGAMEGGSFGSKGHLFDLGGINGIMKILMYDRNIPFVEPAPSSLKKFLAEHGSSGKGDMIDAACEHTGSDPLSEAIRMDKGGNLADAYGLAFMARTVYTGVELESNTREAALESVLDNQSRVQNPVPLFHER